MLFSAYMLKPYWISYSSHCDFVKLFCFFQFFFKYFSSVFSFIKKNHAYSFLWENVKVLIA